MSNRKQYKISEGQEPSPAQAPVEQPSGSEKSTDETISFFGFTPLPKTGKAVTNELINRLREESLLQENQLDALSEEEPNEQVISPPGRS